MATIKLQLDNQTFERVQAIAARCHFTVETLLQDVIQSLVSVETRDDPILGMFAQEPDLLDAVVASAMQGRESNPLRLSAG